MASAEIPSKVTKTKFVRVPQGSVIESDEEWRRCGKWMLMHADADLGFIDTAWASLQPLVSDGTLIMLKASTAAMVPEGATVHCFTRPGKQEAKRAAAAIRKVVHYRGIMHYKLNRCTDDRVDHRYGDRCISIYMQTFLGGFYERKNRIWTLDDEDSEDNKVPISSQFYKQNYSGVEELPSKSRKRLWNLPEDNKRYSGANWYLFCSCAEEDIYLADVDRVWLVANQLFREGVFKVIFLNKEENKKCAKIRFCVSENCDVYSLLPFCDRIFNEASVRTLMYFTTGMDKNDMKFTDGNEQWDVIYDYKYTPEGELYEKGRYADNLVFLKGEH